MENSKSNIYNIALIAVFTVIISVLSALKLGFEILGVPATLQTFAMAFAGFVLGSKKGTLTIFIYILLGTIGIPVFSGFTGGIGVLLGVTGGFIFGFLFIGFFSGLGMQIIKIHNIVLLTIIRIVLSILGLFICHVFGSIAAGIYLEMPTWNAALLVSIPYIPKDIVSIILAYILALAVRKAMVTAKLGEFLYPKKTI